MKIEKVKKEIQFLELVAEDPLQYARQSGFAEIASRASCNGELVIVVVNRGAIRLALNLYASLLKCGVSNILCVALDESSKIALASLGLPVFSDPINMNCEENFAAFGSSSFNKITSLKFVPVISALSLGLSVLFADADVVAMRNPFEYFRRHSSDLTIQYGQGEILNTPDFLKGASPIGKAGDALEYACSGLFYVRPSVGSLSLFRKAIRLLADKYDEQYFDQDALNEAMQQPEEGVIVEVADPLLFPNGGLIIRPSAVRRLSRKNAVMVHANYVVGERQKIRLFKRLRQWYSQPERVVREYAAAAKLA